MSSNTLPLGIVFFLMLGGGALILWQAWQVTARTQELEATGKTVVGTITGLRRGLGKQRGMTYLTYHAEITAANGSTTFVDKTEPVNTANCISLAEKDSVSVFYWPYDPQGTAQLSSLYGGKGFWDWQDGIAVSATIMLAVGSIGFISMTNGARPANSRSAPSNTPDGARAKMLAEAQDVESALTPYMATWRAVPDLLVHKVTPKDVGPTSLYIIAEVDYGHCTQGGFYAYALPGDASLPAKAPPVGWPLDTYFYLADVPFSGRVITCTPDNWSVVKDQDLGDGWSHGTVIIKVADPEKVTPTTAQ